MTTRQKSQSNLKTVTLEVTFDPAVPDRKSRAGIGVWDIEAETADGFRLYVQVYEPARQKPQKQSTAKVSVK